MQVSDQKFMYIALIGLMIVGSITVTLVFTTWDKFNPEEREEPHDYIIEGALNGEAVSGKGRSEYCDETGIDRLFVFTMTFASSNASREYEFAFAFDKSDVPLTNLYSKEGSVTFEGKTLDLWKFSSDGADYSMYVGTLCTVERFKVHTADFDIVGKNVDW